MRRVISLVSLVMILLTLAVPARACFWDSDTVRTEREFKQNYEFKSGSPQESAEPATDNFPSLTLSGWVAACAGVGLMAASVGYVRHNQRKSD